MDLDNDGIKIHEFYAYWKLRKEEKTENRGLKTQTSRSNEYKNEKQDIFYIKYFSFHSIFYDSKTVISTWYELYKPKRPRKEV